MSTGLRIARIQPPHHGHIDAIKQALNFGLEKIIIGIGSSNISHTAENPFTIQEREHMLQTILEAEGLLPYTDIHHVPDFPDDTQRVQHILQTLPTFTHVVSDNPRVNDQFRNKIIFQPQNHLPIRASQIRDALRTNNHENIEQYLNPQTLQYLKHIGALNRLKNI